MKVLLRDGRNGLYCGRGDNWVAAIEEAAEFDTIKAAGQKARDPDFDEVEVVLKYDNPQCELALNPAYCV
jgi:hypothetical protein